jgi:hypothetical protein
MPRKKSLNLTEAELPLVNALWEKGSATVAVISEALPKKPPCAFSRTKPASGAASLVLNLVEEDRSEGERKRIQALLKEDHHDRHDPGGGTEQSVAGGDRHDPGLARAEISPANRDLRQRRNSLRHLVVGAGCDPPFAHGAANSGNSPAAARSLSQPDLQTPVIQEAPVIVTSETTDRPLAAAGSRAVGGGVSHRALQIVRSYFYLRGAKRRAALSRRLLPAVGRKTNNAPAPRQNFISHGGRIPSPAVLLRESLPEEPEEAELQHLLLHETAHITRCDDWTNLAARLPGAAPGSGMDTAADRARKRNGLATTG